MIWWLLYCFIAGIYFYNSKNTEHWIVALMLSIGWPVIAGLWCLGALLVWMEDRELKRMCKREYK